MDVTITDPREVRRILADPVQRVPEADAASATATERLRAATSRFVNGVVHDLRRARLEQRLAALDPEDLARTASRRTHDARGSAASGITRIVPVATLAEHLGFDAPDELPTLIAEIAEVYATGATPGAGFDVADAASERALDAAPGRDPALAVQLLVQAHLATSALIDGALRSIKADPGLTTRAALARTLRHDAPVPSTRRLRRDGTLMVLRLGAAECEGGRGDDAEEPEGSLAFGAGPRSCPAPAHALAIAAAVVDGLRGPEPAITRGAAVGSRR
ncbi:hypothetical protein [Agromyces sp. Leaf222]|uniref:hypothetical protein n=1 Tax=Agromyces sp. Leaf222 TaxID=1735688 RepID=UPI0006F531C9|nr:hypothetical protein [Agromyces sp. Leaf222]KQM83762.1 hypothetical protein ASE68_11565 [Agromyces sp. Leaf222]